MKARQSATFLRDVRRFALRRAAFPVSTAAMLFAAVAQASASFGLPLDCRPGATCWIANYVDLDSGARAADYRCGPLTYDGHTGTDFAIRDLGVLREGVAVRAAASGTVQSTRDGEPDRRVRDAGAGSVDGRECGNGVRIDHGGGLVTQYCHLRKGSVGVRRGDRVEAGQQVGLVGLSGETEFPHVHFAVFHDGAAVDPFSGRTAAQGCGAASGSGSGSLWDPAAQQALPYARRQVYNLGLAGEVPQVERVRAGDYVRASVPADATVLAVWMEAFGVAKGDRVRLEIVGPDGRSVVRSDEAVEKDFARVFRWAGKRRGKDPWPPGSYRLSAEILAADGAEPSRATAVVEVKG